MSTHLIDADTLTADDRKRMSEIAAELRSADLVRALRNAVNGAPHWRFEATILLQMIDAGEVHHAA